MTQLVELQEALPKLEAAGIKLYAVSYDAPGALADFARHHDITFPLLSDKGSKVIRAYGIQNHFVTREQVPYHGIPFPGTYLLDEQGVVTAKFFSRSLAMRESAEAVIDSALGEILLGGEEPSERGGDDEIRVSATYHGGGGNVKLGALRQLVVRFELAPGLHLYDEPVPEGMVATRIQVSGPPDLFQAGIVKPPTRSLVLPGLDAELQVWEGRVDFAIPLWVGEEIASMVRKNPRDEIEIEVKLDYQACDDRACRVPRRETLRVRVPVERIIGHEIPGRMPGAEISPMNSAKHMRRMVGRGLLRNPIGGIRYLRQNLRALRAGPMGRSAGE